MRVRVCALMMTLLLLLSAGCGKQTDRVREQAEQFRSALSTSALSFECRLNIDYGDRVYEFTLAYAHDPGGADTLTVLEPESIAGLSVSMDGDSLEMLFNGARLETGVLDGGISAVTALPMMLSAWTNGTIESIGKEKLDETDCYVIEFITYTGEQEHSWQLWVEQNTFSPVYAEITTGGAAAVRCRFTGFALTGADG